MKALCRLIAPHWSGCIIVPLIPYYYIWALYMYIYQPDHSLRSFNKLVTHPFRAIPRFHITFNFCSSEPPSSFIMHNGPDCYVKPSSKSNRQLIRNAICHVCLAGDVNLSTKQQALRVWPSMVHCVFFCLAIASLILQRCVFGILFHSSSPCHCILECVIMSSNALGFAQSFPGYSWSVAFVLHNVYHAILSCIGIGCQQCSSFFHPLQACDQLQIQGPVLLFWRRKGVFCIPTACMCGDGHITSFGATRT